MYKEIDEEIKLLGFQYIITYRNKGLPTIRIYFEHFLNLASNLQATLSS